MSSRGGCFISVVPYEQGHGGRGGCLIRVVPYRDGAL